MKQRDILFLLTSVFLLVCAWISFTIYHSAVNSKINQEVIEQTLPIDQNFNTNALDALKGRELVNPVDSFVQPQSVIPTQSPTPGLQQNQIILSVSTTPNPTPGISQAPAQQFITPSPSQQPTGSINSSL